MAGPTPLRLGLIGIGGRMGQEIVALAEADPLVGIVGGIGRDNAPDLPVLVRDCDVLIDFSTPESSITAASAAAEAGRPIVIGTTGLDAHQLVLLRDASGRVPVWYARNMSTGVSLLQRLLPEIARALDGYDIELIEAHHRHKIDAPSGTALMLAEAILTGLSDAHEHPLVHGREGHAPRQPGEVGVHAIRGGEGGPRPGSGLVRSGVTWATMHGTSPVAVEILSGWHRFDAGSGRTTVVSWKARSGRTI
jgi:4-hydroxy-tetrahydrodipicolinate reductase